MEIAGISLQLIAGILYGLSFLISESWFRKPNIIVQKILGWPIEQEKRRLTIVIIAVLCIPVVFFIGVGFMESSRGGDATPWYDILGTALVATVFGGFFYTLSVKRIHTIVKPCKALTHFLDCNYESQLFRTNVILLPCIITLSMSCYFVSYYIFQSVSTDTTSGFLVALFLGLPFAFIFAVGFVMAIMAAVYIIVYSYLKAIGLMLKAEKGPVWAVVLQVYIIGGILLLICACR